MFYNIKVLLLYQVFMVIVLRLFSINLCRDDMVLRFSFMVYVNSIKRLILKADLRRESRILFFISVLNHYLCYMKELEKINKLIQNNNIEQAIAALNIFIADNKSCDEAYFLLGNAYCKKNAWREALNAYCQATELNPDGPAQMAYDHIIEILNFFHHDLYNP